MPVSPFQRAAQEELGSQDIRDNNIPCGREVNPGPGRPAGTPDWTPAFISALYEGASAKDAAAHAGVHPITPYNRRRIDKTFREAWKKAVQIGTGLLEEEAQRRAYHGVLEPVYQKGECVGYIRRYSDQLMIFMLKSRRPEVYRDGLPDGRGNVQININVATVDKPIQVDVTDATHPENAMPRIPLEEEPPATTAAPTTNDTADQMTGIPAGASPLLADGSSAIHIDMVDAITTPIGSLADTIARARDQEQDNRDAANAVETPW